MFQIKKKKNKNVEPLQINKEKVIQSNVMYKKPAKEIQGCICTQHITPIPKKNVVKIIKLIKFPNFKERRLKKKFSKDETMSSHVT